MFQISVYWKSQQEEKENPLILVNQASTATLFEQTIFEGSNFLSPPMPKERKKEWLALTLNRLMDKNARYESYKEFLLQFIQAWLIPKGLNLS